MPCVVGKIKEDLFGCAVWAFGKEMIGGHGPKRGAVATKLKGAGRSYEFDALDNRASRESGYAMCRT